MSDASKQSSQLRYAVITSFMGQLRDRFHVYGEPNSIEQRLKKIRQVEGATGVEIIYPYDLTELQKIKSVLSDLGLSVSSVNLNVKAEPIWRDGSFTSRSAPARAQAVRWLKEAMDVAAELGAGLVTTAPLNDGFEYPFQMDYQQAWEWLVEGIREGASHRSDVRVSVEYKKSEPRSRVILDTAAKSLVLCEQVGLANVGVTIDLGHALYAGETSAQAISLLAGAGRLFLVHVNDNYRDWDWDLVPGTINFWDLVEAIYYLRRVGYQGWYVADVFPARTEPIRTFSVTYQMLELAAGFVERIGVERLNDLLAAGDPLAAMQELLAPWFKSLEYNS